MELSYRQLERVLIAHYQIHPDREAAFRSRLKQLQRLKFPPGVNVGRGEKVQYTAAHLFQLVAAFELINLGFPPGVATEIVERRWLNFSSGFGLALWHRRRNRVMRQVYVRVLNRTLTDSDPDDLPRVFVEDQASLTDILTRHSDRTAHSYAVICVTDVVFNIVSLLKLAQVHNAIDDEEVLAWQPYGRSEEYPFWMRAFDDWLLDRDEMPSGDPPYFIAFPLASFLSKHTDLAAKFASADPTSVKLTRDELDVMIGLGFLKDKGPDQAAPLTPLGRAACQYIRRENFDGKRS